MEPIEIFTAAVLIVGTLHLVVTAGTGITHWWNKRLLAKNCSINATDAATVVQAELVSVASGQPRSDWYVFFHCADLVGREPVAKKPQSRQDKTVCLGKQPQSIKRLPRRAEARR